MMFGGVPGIGAEGISAVGSPYSGTDLSEVSLLASLLSDYRGQKTYLFHARPYDKRLQARVDVKLSTDGFGSNSDDTLPDGSSAANWFFRSGLLQPYAARNDVMSDGVLSGSLGGGSSSEKESANVRSSDIDAISRVDVTVEILTGRLRYIAQYEWDSAPVTLYVGKPGWDLHDFVVLFSGVCAAINQIDSEVIHIPILDNSYKVQVPLQKQIYSGQGAALRGNGTTTFGAATIACPAGDMTLELFYRPKTLSTAERYIAAWRNGVSAPGNLAIRFDSGATNNDLTFRAVNDAGTPFAVSGGQLTSLLHRYHIAAVRSVGDNQIRIYVDGALINRTTISGVFNTSLTGFKTLRQPDASAGFNDGDIDEIRLHNVARPLTWLVDNSKKILPNSTPNLVAYWKHDEGTGATAFEAVSGGSTVKDLSYSGTVKWVGTLEGSSDVAGQGPPIFEGVSRQVNPVLVDSQNYVYEISRSPDVGVTVSEVKDKGSAIYTMDATPGSGDVYDWTPVAAHCVTSYQDGRTLLRLQAAPLGVLTVTITGSTTDLSNTVKRLLTVYGGLSTAELDLVAFGQVAANYLQKIYAFVRLDTTSTIWAVAAELVARSGGWLTVSRSGLITLRILELPAIPSFKLSEVDVVAGSAELVARTIAAKGVSLGYRFYQTTQQGTALATSLTEAEKSDLSQQYRYITTPIDQSVIDVRPNALLVKQQTAYDDPNETDIEAARRQTIWGKNLTTFSIGLTRGIFNYDIGDVVELTIRDIGYMQIGRGYIQELVEYVGMVVGYTEVPTLDSISLRIWGEEPPVRIGVLCVGLGSTALETGGAEGELIEMTSSEDL